jgi:chromosome segregation ATPase
MGSDRKRFALHALALAFTFSMAIAPSVARPQDASQSTGDPVADAARKARAKKKQDSDKPKKVYTDDDVNHSVPEATPAEKPADAAGAKPESAGQDKGAAANGAETNGADARSKEEQKWRQRFQEAYRNLARAEKELDILQREANKAQTQYYTDPQKAMEEQYTRKEINEKDTQIAAKKKEIADLKQRINDMQDDLRKAGGDPGWANP